MLLMAVKKSAKRFGFVIFFMYILKTEHSQQLKGVQKYKLGYVKGVPSVNRTYTKRVPFWIKMACAWVPCVIVFMLNCH